MAQPLRRPLLAAAQRSSPSLWPVVHPRRCFAQTTAAQRSQRGGQHSSRQTSQPSFRIQAKQSMTRAPDIGLLEQTFVAPTGKNMSSIFRQPRQFLWMHWTHLRMKFRDAFSNVVLKITSPVGARWYKRRVQLHRSRIVPSAIALHRAMYTAFAAGDVPALRTVCTDGIYEQFRARIAARPRGETVVWELVRYNRRAKIVSHRSARLPIDGAAVRQAVVRISSTQRLSRYNRDGKLIDGTGREKNVVEYVVVDKSYFNWEETDWRVWGTTEETSYKEVTRWQKEMRP